MTTTVSSPAYQGIVKSITHTVISATEPGKEYRVGVNPLSGRAQSCDCLGASYNRLCWHRKLVNDGRCPCKPRVRFQPRPAPHRDLYA